MLSNSSKYAINAVLYLAVHSDESKKISAREIAETISIPSPFLSKLLQVLSKKNVISSSKGPGGGFYMTRDNLNLNLIEIVKHIDGLENFEDCVLGLKKCSSEKPCPVHYSIQPLKKQLFKELNENSIASFAKKVKTGETFLFI
ncbi:MAG: Rrf2 family transcriptional regulator [Flavobacteriaceae bacterium]|nr:Rrf2 family transcriptional regulator [Flavobacteriaceae bacterium]